MQQIIKTTSGKIQIVSGGNICKSLQCNISYTVLDQDRIELIDTTGERATILNSQVNYTQLEPAAKVAASFNSAQELADFLDANFFVG